MMTRLFFTLALLLASPVMATAYERVVDETAFVRIVSGKTLSNRLYGVRLNVSPQGGIAGGAWGSDITGSWTWNNGFFCRDMAWGGDPVEYNCQLVEIRDSTYIRFTSDQGTGDSASFRVR
jgi:hypothetical protein